MNEKAPTRAPEGALMPHQQAFLDRFFEDPSIRGYAIHWEVGLGKSTVAARLVKRVLEAEPRARIIVLVPVPAMLIYMRETLAGIGVDAQAVDRFAFREMHEAAGQGAALWPEGRAFILWMDFAKQDDIARSLTQVPWTLLIVDEAHQLRGQREQVANKIISSSASIRVVLLTATPGTGLPRFGIGPWVCLTRSAANVVGQRVSREAERSTGGFMCRRLPDEFGPLGAKALGRIPNLADSDERPIPHLIARPIAYEIQEPERRLADHVSAVQRLLREAGAPFFLGIILISVLASSPLALEQALRRLRTRLTDGGYDNPAYGGQIEEEITDEVRIRSTALANTTDLLTELDHCLEELDSLPFDTKLAALRGHLAEADSSTTMPRTVCIACEYRATLEYLQSALEDLGLAPFVMHSATTIAERYETIDRVRGHGGILIATTAVLVTGLPLREIEAIILYDKLWSPATLKKLLDAFENSERTTPLTLEVMMERESRGRWANLLRYAGVWLNDLDRGS